MISGCGARQTLPVTLPRGDDQEYVEFKLVMLDDDNRILHWETEGAENNRKIRTDCLRNSIVHCYWGYKDAYDIEHWNGTGMCCSTQSYEISHISMIYISFTKCTCALNTDLFNQMGTFLLCSVIKKTRVRL